MLDLVSRFVVGWAVSAVNDRHLVIKALDMALRRRCPGAGLLHHSDQGRPVSGTTPSLRYECGPQRLRWYAARMTAEGWTEARLQRLIAEKTLESASLEYKRGAALAKNDAAKNEISNSSSSFPHYSRNLNTGLTNEWTDKIEVATQTILHDNEHPSRLVLSVAPDVKAP